MATLECGGVWAGGRAVCTRALKRERFGDKKPRSDERVCELQEGAGMVRLHGIAICSVVAANVGSIILVYSML